MQKKRVRKILGFSFFFISFAMIILGVVTGDLDEGIFQKAVNICLECIGIG